MEDRPDVSRSFRLFARGTLSPAGAPGRYTLSFTLGNRPYLVAYVAKIGVFNIYSIGNNLALSKPLLFFRNHELALSQGFATVKSFSLFGEVAFLGYRNDTGYVAMYTLVMTSTSPVSGCRATRTSSTMALIYRPNETTLG